jgi:photosystem II stability/assembly factor-like uncharacterized protein
VTDRGAIIHTQNGGSSWDRVKIDAPRLNGVVGARTGLILIGRGC